ncbi:MAG: four helix bundle protein [Bacteroidia bacterium]|nr:four helix bundle protein [Bacteroidia bacterium]MCF8445906.1 four helix bundle protein [Bacteroidia bacterium]
MENSKDVIQMAQKNFSKYHPLADQIIRSAISIPSNIAEGHERNSKLDFIRFLHISKGSNAELKTQLILSKSFIETDSHKHIDSLILKTDSVSKMLYKLIQSLK